MSNVKKHWKFVIEHLPENTLVNIVIPAIFKRESRVFLF